MFVEQSELELQPEPAGHFGHVEPPQSTAVSAPFLMLSVHVAAAQTFDWQLAVVQSVPDAQPLPTPHLGQPPPQSMSVSVPFFAPSPHEAVWQTPLEHTPVVQSPVPPQLRPGWHFGHVGPPQSLSDS